MRTSYLKDNLFLVPAFFLAVVAVCFITASDFEEEQAQEAQYCEMVRLYKQGDGYGWPDYNKNYNEICKR